MNSLSASRRPSPTTISQGLLSCCTPITSTTTGSRQPGKDGSVAVFAAFLDAFEGFRVDTDDVLEAGDSLVGRYTYRGRHTGEFLGIPPSGAEVEMHSIDIWRVSDGQLVEHWDELNTLEFFQQIGAVPALA